MRKKILEKRMARLVAKKNALVERSNASTDVNELRSINEQLNDVNADIAETQEEIDACVDDEPATDPEQRGGNPMQSYVAGSFTAPTPETRTGNALDSMEYRNAFMKYVQTGEWSYEKRADETLVTSDVGKVIPNTIMQEFIKQLKTYGNIYNRVRKLNVKGGVEFPIEELVPTVSWITETTISDTQDVPHITTSVSFGYHIVEARLAQSLLSQVVSLSYLETEMANLLAEAFVKEFDNVIINGSGSGQPLGILNDSRVANTNNITFSATQIADWTEWRKRLFAKIPLSYRGQGVFIMTAATWETYIMTLKDSNNRPLGVETYGIEDGATVCKFAGREVLLVEPDIIDDYDAAASGDAWAIYFKPTDYAINSNMQLAFKRWFDDDKNKYFNKGLAIMDGKLLDTNSVYILKK